jgi:hypothetical protein
MKLAVNRSIDTKATDTFNMWAGGPVGIDVNTPKQRHDGPFKVRKKWSQLDFSDVEKSSTDHGNFEATPKSS